MKQVLTHSKTYKIHKKLGEGGFGKVYLVQDLTFDPNFQKPLALKIIKEAKLDSGLRDYYLKLSRLGLKNVVNFYGTESLDQKFGMLFEYIDGPNLRDYLNQEKCPKKIKNLLIQICKTLSKLHQNEMFHGDLDFENLLIHPQRGIVFIDFDPRFNVGRRNLNKIGIESDLENLKSIILEILEEFPELSIETQSFLFELATEMERQETYKLMLYFSKLVEENDFSYSYQSCAHLNEEAETQFFTKATSRKQLKALDFVLLLIASLIIFFPSI
ncbi:MAG: protein kinase family protein [Bdellovibrionota bacterium]|nr:protein kinase family protein [Bdellovibrionota bacterium]